MAAGTYGLKMPEIFHPNGINPHTLTIPKATSTSDSHVKGIGVKSWVKLSTNSVIVLAGGNENPYGRVVSIRDPQNHWLNIQFVTAAQLLANIYILDIEPCGGMQYMATEDADTTPITNTSVNAAQTTTTYINFAAPTDPTTPDGNINPYGSPVQKLVLDSSTITTTAGTTCMILLDLVPNYGNRPYSSVSLASPRTFLVTPRAATASQVSN